MEKCPQCGADFQDGRCLNCGRDSADALRAKNKELQKYLYLSVVGLVGILIGVHFYPLLDGNSLILWAMGFFFLPISAHIIVAARKRVSTNAEWLRSTYIFSGAVLILFFLFILLNGALDRSAATPVRTAVISKKISHGRRSTSYYLIVASWRDGKFEEKLQVSSGTYRSLFVGEPVVVEVHPGRFGLTWYGQISAAPAG